MTLQTSVRVSVQQNSLKPSLMFKLKPELNQIENFSNTPLLGTVLVLPASIKQDHCSFPRPNALAYFCRWVIDN
jgi:hypothetical protein